MITDAEFIRIVNYVKSNYGIDLNQKRTLVTGRLDNNSIVHFPGDSSMIGNIYNVRLDECKGFYYMGELADA